MTDKFTAVLIIISAAAVVLTSCADEKDQYRCDWTLSGKVAVSSGYTFPCITVDSNDIVHIAWEQEDPYSDIYYTNSANPEITANISNTGNAGQPKIAVSRDQVVYVGWHEYWGGHAHGHIANSTDWAGTLTNLSPLADVSCRPLIDADPQGVVHAVWVEEEMSGPMTVIDWWVVYANSTDWVGTKETILEPTSWLVGPAMAVDSNGIVHVAWQDYVIGSDYDIFYVNSTNWSATPVNVSSTDGRSSACSIVIDTNDVVHIIWTEEMQVSPWIEVQYANSGNWISTRTTIPVHSYWPAMTMDSNDVVHIVWDQNTGSDWEIFYANSTDWFATQTNVSNTTRGSWWDSERPDIAVDSHGVAHIVWEERYSGSQCEVWYTNFNP